MAINIRSNEIGGIYVQSGNGIPSHISPIGSLFIDVNVPNGYLSYGNGSWRDIGGSGTTGFDVYVTGGTYSNGSATFTNNTGGTFSVTGFSASASFTGGTITGPTNFTNGLTANTISATTYLNLPIDIRVTGGTYSNGSTTFTNNTGGTFSVNGFFTGNTDIYTTASTLNNSTVTFTRNDANTYSVNLSGLILANYLPLSGGSLNGPVISNSGLTANTISATTYLNLPVDVRVTGGTTNNNNKTYTFTNNTGGTFSLTGLTDIFVTGATTNNGTKIYTFTNNTGGTFTLSGLTDISITGGTYSNGSATFTNNTGGTFSVTGLTTPFTGGTVAGATNFTGGLTANTISAITITASTRLAVGLTAFNTSNPERILADDGSLGTGFSNTIVGKANTNNYAQFNITNSNSGTSASSDLVATANNGNESINYINMGINSSGYTGTSVGLNNDAYLFSTGNNLYIGNATANKNIQLFTDGETSANTRVTITSASTRFDVPILSGATNLMTYINNTTSYYSILRSGGGGLPASTTSGTFLMTGQFNTSVKSNNTVSASIGISYINLASADYPTINGLSPKLRIRASLSTNSIAPTGGFTFGLYPVRVTGGTASNITFSAGTVVTGSQPSSIIAPASGTTTNVVSSDFAFPTDGLYVIGLVTTATTAANSIVTFISDLQMRYL